MVGQENKTEKMHNEIKKKCQKKFMDEVIDYGLNKINTCEFRIILWKMSHCWKPKHSFKISHDSAHNANSVWAKWHKTRSVACVMFTTELQQMGSPKVLIGALTSSVPKLYQPSFRWWINAYNQRINVIADPEKVLDINLALPNVLDPQYGTGLYMYALLQAS